MLDVFYSKMNLQEIRGSPATPELGGGPATVQPSSANNPMTGCSTR
jgi:hypothetical protein